jgi:YfiH family protein
LTTAARPAARRRAEDRVPLDRLPIEAVPGFDEFGVCAFTTRREAGTFGLSGDDPVEEVMTRWTTLQQEVAREARRMVLARQVHGTRVLEHSAGGWTGWLRTGEADGHVAMERETALTVTIADCVPIFIAHPSGTVALLHSGWRGTAARIIDAGIAALVAIGKPAAELRVHLGPAICGRCYEVTAEVRTQLTGMPANRPGHVDLRALIAEHARAAGVKDLSVSEFCTKCDNDRFFSYRAGDSGRQVAVIAAAASAHEMDR